MRAVRAVRADLSGVSDADARRVLALVEVTINAELARFTTIHLAGMDLDDLRQLARIAVLEAFATHQEARGARFKTWASRIVRWRICEAIQAAQPREEIRAELPEPPALDGEEVLDIREKLHWLEEAFGRLTPREKLIIVKRLEGESWKTLSATISINISRAHQVRSNAVARLREEASAYGIAEAV